MQKTCNITLEKLDDYRYIIPKSAKPGMKVDGIVYTSEKLLAHIKNDMSLEQVANVAMLPGIVKYSLAMPDIHWGYGFCIGGVAATDIKNGGVISPGGVGFDINCGVRMLRSELSKEEVAPNLRTLVDTMFSDVPCGVGSKGDIRVSEAEEKKLMIKGSRWAVEKGYGVAEDLEHTEERGAIEGANPDNVSERTYERGKNQQGTLGSGNHFIEVQFVEEIYDEPIASRLGIFKNQVTLMIHSGSRGFGYQICDEYAHAMIKAMAKYGISMPDRQLACVPVESQEGQAYLSAMRCAANYAWSNRQCLMHLARKVFEKIFQSSWQKLGLNLIYDVAHNIAKIEKYNIDGKERLLCIHRKGATRAFGPGNSELPSEFKDIGQPVIIPGDMGRNSYLLVGTKKAEEETFGSTCHGAGRLMSRAAAVKGTRDEDVARYLESQGIIVRGFGRGALAEERPQAYKNVTDVIDVVHGAGISKKVCKMRPMGVIKG